MKKAGLLPVAVVVLSVQTFGQGLIVFGNRIPVLGLDAPVFDVDCQTRVPGPAFVAQAYAGITPDNLTPMGWPVEFRTGPAAGYLLSHAVDIVGTYHGARVYFQMRAWEAGAGGTYEEAVANGGKHGVSNIVPMQVEEPPAPSEIPIGLRSFCLVEGTPLDRPSFLRVDVVENQVVMTLANPLPGQWVRIEGSRDLVHWVELGNVLTTNRFSAIAHGESLAAGPYRFYRLRAPGTSVEQARERWRSQGIDSYAYTIQYRVWGRKLHGYRARVSVVDGIKRVSDVTDWWGEPVTTFDPDDFPTIEELFDRLEEAAGRGVRFVQARYDEQRSFPFRAEIDEREFVSHPYWLEVSGVDAEYTVSDLTIEAGQP